MRSADAVSSPQDADLPVSEVQPRRTTKTERELWLIHGEFYDLEEYIQFHPGGAYNLILGRGRDCTELFESVHVFAEDSRPKKILEKYRVVRIGASDGLPHDMAPIPERYTWEKGGFYDVVSTRVRNMFRGRNRKAPLLTKVKIAAMLLAYAALWAAAVRQGSVLYAFLAGMLTEMIGFCVMHAASHGALSSSSTVNYIGTLWSAYMMWNHWLWLQHHTWGHHSNTGVFKLDPDVRNAKLFVRKHGEERSWNAHSHQWWSVWPLHLVFPNQHLGQVLAYVKSSTNQRLFGMPIFFAPDNIQMHSYAAMTLSAFVHFVVPCVLAGPLTALLLVAALYSAMGISYFMNVAPNHDQETTTQQHVPEVMAKLSQGQSAGVEPAKMDWGEHQVRTTGNHSISSSLVSKLITSLWGGMNYQVEHHLYPTLNDAHYPEIAPVVQQTCKEFNIPYDGHKTWLEAMLSYGKHIALLAPSSKAVAAAE